MRNAVNMKLTADVKEAMSKNKIFALATASKDGVPNVVPIGMLMLKDDENIWAIDNYMDKTLANVKENPQASFYVWVPELPNSFQVKCDVTVEDSGPDYEEAVKFAHSIKEIYPAKTLLKLKVREVFYTTPGANAGKKV
jgi:predicted pyridoxine 5'-phosphate oxidase superfamily flavin-nucleotide-binding protein